MLAGAGADAPRIVAVDTAEAGGEEASTVVDVTEAPPRVLRWGALAAAQVEPVLERIAAP